MKKKCKKEARPCKCEMEVIEQGKSGYTLRCKTCGMIKSVNR